MSELKKLTKRAKEILDREHKLEDEILQLEHYGVSTTTEKLTIKLSLLVEKRNGLNRRITLLGGEVVRDSNIEWEE